MLRTLTTARFDTLQSNQLLPVPRVVTVDSNDDLDVDSLLGADRFLIGAGMRRDIFCRSLWHHDVSFEPIDLGLANHGSGHAQRPPPRKHRKAPGR